MNGHYDIILGQDILTKLEIVQDFEQRMVWWGNKIVKMRTTDFIQETSYFIHDTLDIAAETDRMSKTLDTKYQPANLEEVATKNNNLTSMQLSVLRELLKKY